jgi:hypothetical protein
MIRHLAGQERPAPRSPLCCLSGGLVPHREKDASMSRSDTWRAWSVACCQAVIERCGDRVEAHGAEEALRAPLTEPMPFVSEAVSRERLPLQRVDSSRQLDKLTGQSSARSDLMTNERTTVDRLYRCDPLALFPTSHLCCCFPPHPAARL